MRERIVVFSVSIKQGDQSVQVGQSIWSFSIPAKSDAYIDVMSKKEHDKKARATKKERINKRSGVQLKTCWMWCHDIAKAGIGSYSEAKDFYIEFKFKYLAPLICQDDADYALFHEAIQAYRLTRTPHEFLIICNDAYSTSKGTVKQMHNAMNVWRNFYAGQGVNFRDPDKYKAMLQDEFYKGLIK